MDYPTNNVTIPRTHHEALMAAAKDWIKINAAAPNQGCKCAWCEKKRKILAALRAAGIHLMEEC